jgi:hypothetical protein
MKLDLCSRVLAGAALLIGVTGVASAQSADINNGFYLGTFAGVARYPNHSHVDVGTFTLNSTDTREEHMSWGFTGGYRFGRYFAMEAGYVDLGEGTAKLVDAAGSDLRADLRFAARGETFALVGIVPFGSRWEASFKLGMLHQDVDFRLSGTQSGAPFALSSTARRGLRLYQEAAISYGFNSHWKTSLILSHFPSVGDESRTGRANLLNTSLGVYYQF